jgi:hypothetical protein
VSILYQKRLAGSLLIAVCIGLLVWLSWRNPTGLNPDLYQPWLGAKLLLGGRNPYGLIGPGKLFPHEFPFLYPITACVIVLPLSVFPIAVAVGIFSGVSAGLLAYALKPYQYPVFLSVPFISAAWAGQWSILYSAVFFIPVLSFLYAGKPSIGAAFFLAGRGKQYGIFGGLLVLAVSIAMLPQWPSEWLQSMKAVSHLKAPAFHSGGFIALVALLRWRVPEARLVALLSLIPQTNLWYEAVPLFLVPRSFRESLILMVSTSTPMIYRILYNRGTFELWPHGYELALFGYLPCVVMLLSKPNAPDLQLEEP